MALRVYYLPWSGNNFTNVILKEALVHHAIVLCTDDIDVRKVIMNTDDHTHDRLISVAIKHRLPTQDEIDEYASSSLFAPPDADAQVCQDLLHESHGAITQPEIWLLLRIYGQRLGLYKP